MWEPASKITHLVLSESESCLPTITAKKRSPSNLFCCVGMPSICSYNLCALSYMQPGITTSQKVHKTTIEIILLRIAEL